MARFNELVTLVRDVDHSTGVVKKKTVDRLKEILNDDDILQTLNTNSNDQLNWDALFCAVHRSLLVVEEHRRKKETSALVNLSLQCSSLLTFIVKKACLQLPRIKVKSIVRSFVDVMTVNYLKQHIGSTYIDVLKVVFLSHRKYRSDVTCDDWNDLFQSTLQLYQNPPAHIEHSLVVEVLNIIVLHGTCQSDLSHVTKNLYPVIRGSFQSNQFSRFKFLHQERLLQLAITLCSQTARESRTALCQLGEDVICVLICMYDKFSAKGKILLLNFLLIQLRAHHPGGLGQDSHCSYALDWKKWNICLDSIYNLVLAEINQPVDKKSKHVSSSFLQLAVEVCWQIFDRNSKGVELIEDEDVEGSAPKRRKLDVGIMSLAGCLKTSQDSLINLWFVLSLIRALISKYPESLKEEEFIPLLEHIVELQCSCKNDLLIEQQIFLCCISLLKTEKQFKRLAKTVVNSLWDKIWDMTVRNVGRTQNEKESHSLLQALILHDKARNLPDFVKLFLDNTFPASVSSVQTLNVLLGKYDLSGLSPSGAVSASGHRAKRNEFLEWLLPESSSEIDSSIVHILAEVLVQLTSKTVRPAKSSDGSQTDSCTLDIMLLKMEKDYVISSFMTEVVQEDFTNSSTVSHDTCLDALTWDFIQKLLIRRSTFVLTSLNTRPFSITNLKNAFYHLSLLVEVWVVFSEAFPHPPLFQENMEFLMKYLSRHLIGQLNNSGNCAPGISDVFHEFQELLCIKYPDHISQWFCNSIFLQLVKSTINFVISENSTLLESDILEMDDFSNGRNENEDKISSSLDECFNIEHSHIPQLSTENLTEDQRLRLECLKFLGCFYTLGSGHYSQVSELGNNMLNSIPLNDLYNFNGVAWIVQCLIENNTMDPSVVYSALVQLKYLFSPWVNDSETTLVFLYLLKGMVRHVHNTGVVRDKHNFVALISGIFKSISRHKYGVKVSVGFVKCLETVSKVDPSASWSRNEDRPCVELILTFLDSASHEVRLAAISSLKIVLMHSAGCMDDSWHFKIFSEMCEKINLSFIVEEDLGTCFAIDEVANRSTSALHAFIGVIIGSPVLYKEALFKLLKFCKQKNLDIDLFKRGISYFGSINNIDARKFLERNLPYLVRKWLEEKYPLQELNNYLFQLPPSAFYANYQGVLVPIVLLRDDITALNEMGRVINKNMMEMFEDCFPQIMGELLPGIQANSATALRCQEHIESVISRVGVETLLTSKLPQVLVAVFKKVHDRDHFMNLTRTRMTLSQPDLSSISFETAEKCIKHLQKGSPSPEINLLEFLCEISPKHIQMILLELTVDIYEAVLLQDKLESFYHYAIFVSCLASDMKKRNVSAMVPYVVCCIVHTLTHLIKNATDVGITLSIAACNFLKYFCELCIPNNGNVVGKLLVMMTDTLVPAVKSGGILGSAALSLLNFIFVEKFELFSETILLIDSLPTDPVFQGIRNAIENLKNRKCTPSLEEEISSFLQVRYLSGKQGVENLRHLHQLLSHRKEELKTMYDNLHSSRGFSEDCRKSLIHRLVCRLIELAASSELEVSIQAGHCLGEIGPSDLGTLVLKPDAGIPVLDVCDIVPLVAECLVDENIKVVKAASGAMYSLLKYKECNNLTGKQVTMSCGIPCINFVHPFNVRKKSQTLSFEVNNSLSLAQISDKNLWYPTEEMDHESWVIHLTTTLLSYLLKGNNFLSALIPLCEVKVGFSEKILPLFVSKLMNISSECGKTIVQYVENFFENHVRLSCSKISDTSNKVCLNKASVQCMLNLVHFLRVYDSSKNIEWNPSKLDLNYLNVAQAAQFCNAYFSSILYVELWSDKWLRSENTEEIYGQSQTVLERISERNPDEGGIAQKVLWEAYLKICDTDAIYGCGSSLLLDPSKRPLHYELRSQWDKVILSHDVRLSLGFSDSSRGLMYALQKGGFQHVLDVYLRSVTDAKGSEDLQYECAWRLSKWDSQHVNSFSQQGNFEQYHFLALRALSDSDKIGHTEALTEAHKCVSESLINLSLESCKSIYKPLSQFQQIQEMNEFQSIKGELDLDDLIKKWQQRDEITFNDFEDIEPIFWQRIVMLNSCQENSLKLKAAEVAGKLASLAREENQLQVAAKCLGSFNECHLPSNLNGLLKIEEARLAWNSGDVTVGKRIMRDLLATLDQQNVVSQNPVMNAQALKLYGDWMVETKSENPQVVIDRYYLKALKILNDIGDSVSENVLDIYSTLAHLADGQYQNLSNYFKSRAYEIKKEWIQKAEQDIENINKLKDSTMDDKRTMNIKLRQTKIDKEELHNTARQRDKYLAEAVKYYLRCLEFGDHNNLDVFRVASLWLENMLHSSLKVVLDASLFNVPSYKFVPVLPQLTPRMSNTKDDFTIKLNKLLVRCAEDHPHHTLPIILALANSYKDQDYTQGVTSSQKRNGEPRVLGAQKLIQILSKHQNIGELLKKMDEVSFALISMAYVNPERAKGNDRLIPENELLRKLKNVETVLVPTLTIPVEKSCKYTNIIGIAKYEPSYSLVGGINAPKKLICLGTDGVKRLQLIKGKDDLRQDAVMQQVFTIMNTFLQKSKDTSKRKLLIRTYKVLPLSQRSGVIEWCENTVPILHYLSGINKTCGAHKKYYPADKGSMECREIMKSVCMKSAEKKLETFKRICCSIRPVFRYFFLEHFTTPGTWFERRLAYIHSVATSSMIGYILGLGDRHLQNILIDKSTAEVIHIDFGIAFEMGHILPTPETVPFRLTRDIVDGMGVSGVEGVFQRSCEKTMFVLREHQTILLTVLEVLLYDPLYAWTITPSKAYKVQNKDMKLLDETDSIQVNRMAERALQRLQQKLLGTEVGAGVSVSSQVNRLIQEAADPGNLSRLFCGWEPYL